MKKFILPVLMLLFLTSLFILSGCDLQPDANANMAGGIVIYSGGEILNDRTVEIVTNRVQQLRATSPAGHSIQWISDNPEFIEVNNRGEIRTSRTPNKEVVITAVSMKNPEIKAQVTFRTKGLR